ncbi:hypothetical protein [Halalkalicoccus salilacus]|uniref:hypothetical protein n=1 Tax=Halalkalicoccus TaxID=332246 RepID=UPI002F9674A2
MGLLALAGSFTGLELWALVTLVFTFVAPVVLAILLERRVFGGDEIDPVGLEELERDEDVDGDAWQ